jgi:hypothetical protein
VIPLLAQLIGEPSNDFAFKQVRPRVFLCKYLQNCMKALASICANLDITKKQVIDSQIIPSLVTLLESPNSGT